MSRASRYRPTKKAVEQIRDAPYQASAGSLCTSGKKLYYTRRTARRALRVMYPGQQGEGMREYRCPICDHWHVGHTPKWAKESAA